MIRPPHARARRMSAAVEYGILYGSSKGNKASSCASPVEEMPAAWVSVANATPRRRSVVISCQSSTNPADGGSKATGGPAMRVQTSQSASADGM
jgi:hypothetical protein